MLRSSPHLICTLHPKKLTVDCGGEKEEGWLTSAVYSDFLKAAFGSDGEFFGALCGAELSLVRTSNALGEQRME